MTLEAIRTEAAALYAERASIWSRVTGATAHGEGADGGDVDPRNQR